MKIPQYRQGQVNRQYRVPQVDARLTSSAFGGGEAKGLQSVAQGMGVLAETWERMAQRNAKTEVREARVALDSQMLSMRSEVQERLERGDKPEDVQQWYESSVRGLRERALKSLSSRAKGLGRVVVQADIQSELYRTARHIEKTGDKLEQRSIEAENQMLSRKAMEEEQLDGFEKQMYRLLGNFPAKEDKLVAQRALLQDKLDSLLRRGNTEFASEIFEEYGKNLSPEKFEEYGGKIRLEEAEAELDRNTAAWASLSDLREKAGHVADSLGMDKEEQKAFWERAKAEYRRLDQESRIEDREAEEGFLNEYSRLAASSGIDEFEAVADRYDVPDSFLKKAREDFLKRLDDREKSRQDMLDVQVRMALAKRADFDYNTLLSDERLQELYEIASPELKLDMLQTAKQGATASKKVAKEILGLAEPGLKDLVRDIEEDQQAVTLGHYQLRFYKRLQEELQAQQAADPEYLNKLGYNDKLALRNRLLERVKSWDGDEAARFDVPLYPERALLTPEAKRLNRIPEDATWDVPTPQLRKEIFERTGYNYPDEVFYRTDDPDQIEQIFRWKGELDVLDENEDGERVMTYRPVGLVDDQGEPMMLTNGYRRAPVERVVQFSDGKVAYIEYKGDPNRYYIIHGN